MSAHGQAGVANTRDPARDAAMVEMYRSGQTLEQVGVAFGVTKQRVSMVVARHVRETGESVVRHIPPKPPKPPKIKRPRGRTARPVLVRIRERLRLEGGHVLWVSGDKRGALPVIMLPGKSLVSVRRYLWEWANGPLPSDKCVANGCGNRQCVLPAHGVVVDKAEHMRNAGKVRWASRRAA